MMKKCNQIVSLAVLLTVFISGTYLFYKQSFLGGIMCYSTIATLVVFFCAPNQAQMAWLGCTMIMLVGCSAVIQVLCIAMFAHCLVDKKDKSRRSSRSSSIFSWIIYCDSSVTLGLVIAYAVSAMAIILCLHLLHRRRRYLIRIARQNNAKFEDVEQPISRPIILRPSPMAQRQLSMIIPTIIITPPDSPPPPYSEDEDDELPEKPGAEDDKLPKNPEDEDDKLPEAEEDKLPKKPGAKDEKRPEKPAAQEYELSQKPDQ